MSPRQKKAVLGILSALFIGIVTAATLPAAQAAWGAKVSTTTFETHVGEEKARFDLHEANDRTHRALDSARAKANNDLLLDVLCTVKDQRDRRCKG